MIGDQGPWVYCSRGDKFRPECLKWASKYLFHLSYKLVQSHYNVCCNMFRINIEKRKKLTSITVLKELLNWFCKPPLKLSPVDENMSVNSLVVSENFSEIYSQCDLRFVKAEITSSEAKRSIFAEFSMEKSLNHVSFCLRHSSDFLTYLSQYSSYYETGSGKKFLFTSSSCLLKKIGWSKTSSVLL